MNKAGLRALGKLLRQDEKVSAEMFCRVLCKQPFYQKANTLMLYMSIKDEAPTDAIFRMALHDGKLVCVPVVEGKHLWPCAVDERTDFVFGAFGVAEPKIRRIVTQDAIDLVIVPGLLFDERGNRCGYGGGYYDRFLSEGMPAVGLAYASQVIRAFPVEPHDKRVRYIVTEKELISCES